MSLPTQQTCIHIYKYTPTKTTQSLKEVLLFRSAAADAATVSAAAAASSQEPEQSLSMECCYAISTMNV